MDAYPKNHLRIHQREIQIYDSTIANYRRLLIDVKIQLLSCSILFYFYLKSFYCNVVLFSCIHLFVKGHARQDAPDPPIPPNQFEFLLPIHLFTITFTVHPAFTSSQPSHNAANS